MHSNFFETHGGKKEIGHLLDIEPVSMVGHEEYNGVFLLSAKPVVSLHQTHVVLSWVDAKLATDGLLEDESNIIQQQLKGLPIPVIKLAVQNRVSHAESSIGGQLQSIPAYEPISAFDFSPVDAIWVVMLWKILRLGLQVGVDDPGAIPPVCRKSILAESEFEVVAQVSDTRVDLM